ncbi:MAG: PIG-L family deacetylase [Acidimicrobiia bacterium]|nr:PIG-L family deacetylase [Acidimicrobiia bacterium]
MQSGIYAEAQTTGRPTGVPRRALTIGAHPDDAEFGAGGTLAAWAAAGCEVTMLIVTDGSKGSWDQAIGQQALIDLRMAEQAAAAVVLGAQPPIMLGYTDGELEYSMALREELCLWIRRTRPDVVLTHDPWQRYQLHPDHRVAGMAAIDGVVAARDHLFFADQLREGLEKHRPSWIYLWSSDEADHWVDISPTFERKIEALLAHSSQGVTTMGNAHIGAAERRVFRSRIEKWAHKQATPAELELAESFKVLSP